MTERLRDGDGPGAGGSGLRGRLGGIGGLPRRGLTSTLAPVALVVLLAATTLLPELGVARFGSERSGASAGVAAVVDGLPQDPLVVVAFDPDVGTYAEIRPATRALLETLVERGARLAFVSLTTEGRALLVVEIARLEALAQDAGAGGGDDAVIDLGFVPGAEAAIVALARSVPAPAGAGEALVAELQATGLGAAEALVVIGGIDIGPRTWVEQALPRIGRPPTIAVAPTALLPELLPYVESGQIDGLIATAADAAAYRASAGGADAVGGDRPADAAAVLVGLVVAVAVLSQGLVRRAWPAIATRRRGEAG